MNLPQLTAKKAQKIKISDENDLGEISQSRSDTDNRAKDARQTYELNLQEQKILPDFTVSTVPFIKPDSADTHIHLRSQSSSPQEIVSAKDLKENYPLSQDNNKDYRAEENSPLQTTVSQPALVYDASKMDSNKVNEIITSYLLEYINIIDAILPITKKDISLKNIQQIASKCAEGFLDINKGGSQFLKRLNTAMLTIDDKFLPLLTGKKGPEIEISYNAIFCSSILVLIFGKRFVYEQKNIQVLKINFSEILDTVEVNEVKINWDSIIKQLVDFKNLYYFERLRPLIDPGKDLRSKCMQFHNYSRYLQPKNLKDDHTIFSTLYRASNSILLIEIRNMIENVTHLQILLDCLKKIKKAPKTPANMIIALNICEECYKVYEEEQFLDKNSIYAKNHKKITQFLRELKNQLARCKPIPNDDWLTSTTRGYIEPKNKKNAKIIVPHDASLIQEKSKSPSISIETNEQKPSNEEFKTEDVLSMPLTTDTEVEDIELIERETNELMEVLRQLIERDRKEKLERKEAQKDANFKKPLLVETDKDHVNLKTSTVIEPKPPIIKLSSKRQKTLDMLLKNPPLHFEILGDDVERLITKLNGRVEGAKGSSYTVFWGDSKKHGGTYEVFHKKGAHGDGYLTSEYATRVFEAIETGIAYGYIARETIYGPKEFIN